MCIQVLHIIFIFNIDSNDTSSNILHNQDDLYL